MRRHSTLSAVRSTHWECAGTNMYPATRPRAAGNRNKCPHVAWAQHSDLLLAANDVAVDSSHFGDTVPHMADQATAAESKFHFVQITSLLLRLQITSLCAALVRMDALATPAGLGLSLFFFAALSQSVGSVVNDKKPLITEHRAQSLPSRSFILEQANTQTRRQVTNLQDPSGLVGGARGGYAPVRIPRRATSEILSPIPPIT